MKNSIQFKLNGKLLCEYSVKGTFAGEARSTCELLAYENNCSPEDIEIYVNVEGGAAK